MKKMKTKLFTTVAMLTVSAITLSTASYAWFTMNKEASATGLSLTATAPSNLLISSAATTAADGTYAATTTFTAIAKKFVPVSGSSLDKTAGDKTPTFFYATENTNDGVVSTGFKGATFAAIPGASDTNRQYYADIDLWIKSEKAFDTGISMNLHVKSVEFKTEKLNDAYRVAINDKTDPTTKNYVYAQKADRPWTPLATATALGTPKTADTVATEAAVVATIPTPGTAQKITLRIWLEGQDAACLKANAENAVTFAITFAGKEIVTP